MPQVIPTGIVGHEAATAMLAELHSYLETDKITIEEINNAMSILQ